MEVIRVVEIKQTASVQIAPQPFPRIFGVRLDLQGAGDLNRQFICVFYIFRFNLDDALWKAAAIRVPQRGLTTNA